MNTFQKVLDDDEDSLALMMKGLRLFQERFCNDMQSGEDFTLRLEVHGNRGRVLHVRSYSDQIAKPKSNQCKS